MKRLLHHQTPKKSQRRWNKQTAYRANLQTVITDLKALELRQSHIEVLQRTPFWPLVNSIITEVAVLEHCKKRDKIVKDIIHCFNKESGDFTFGGYTMKIRIDDVRIIFGIRDGAQHINMQLQDYTRVGFLRRCFPEKEGEKRDMRMSKSLLYKILTIKTPSNNDTDVNDIARLVTLYILAAFFISTKSTNIPWAYASLVEDLDTICKYNWSEHILNTLVNSLTQSNSEKHSGCVLLLPYWLCERTVLVNPVQLNLIPRFLKWNLEDFYKRIHTINIQHLDHDLIIKRILKPSHEEDAMLHKETADAPQPPITDQPEHLHADKIFLLGAPPTIKDSTATDTTIAGVLIKLKEQSTDENIFDGDHTDMGNNLVDIPIDELRAENDENVAKESQERTEIKSTEAEQLLQSAKLTIEIQELKATLLTKENEIIELKKKYESFVHEQEILPTTQFLETTEITAQLEETRTLLLLRDHELKEMQDKFEKIKRHNVELEAINALMYADVERLKGEKGALENELNNIKSTSLILTEEKEKLKKENQEQSSIVKRINQRHNMQQKWETYHTYPDNRQSKRSKKVDEEQEENDAGAESKEKFEEKATSDDLKDLELIPDNRQSKRSKKVEEEQEKQEAKVESKEKVEEKATSDEPIDLVLEDGDYFVDDRQKGEKNMTLGQ